MLVSISKMILSMRYLLRYEMTVPTNKFLLQMSKILFNHLEYWSGHIEMLVPTSEFFLLTTKMHWYHRVK